MRVNRRQFLNNSSLLPVFAAASLNTVGASPPSDPVADKRFFFTSQGKTAMMNADGSGLRFLEFDVPGQATWQPGEMFPDGKRVLMLSMEPRRDGPGKPFDEFYHTTPTHIWIHNLETGTLEEIATKQRLAPFISPQLLLADDRLMIQVIRNKVPQSFSINLDGTDPRPFTRPGEGMPYGLHLSPNGKRVAYHLAAPGGYEIRTSDVDGGNKILVAKKPEHLFFGPRWSPAGEWIIFQDCHQSKDPGHDWADLVISRPDGKELRHLTEGQALWFGASYGSPGNYGSGSNMPIWSKDGSILFSRRLPHSKVAWEYKKEQVDVDHFNRAYKPELAQGGTEICRLNLQANTVTRLTMSDPPVWDFRQVESSDAQQLLFCRAETGGTPSIWIMDSDGKHPKLLTKGLRDRGADHPRWIS